jgi:hypothetical protein
VNKIEEAQKALDHVFSVYKNPVFMCSFGKDSMVILDLLRKKKIPPILFHRDPWFPEKYQFADRIINYYGLTVHDYSPSFMTLWQGKSVMAFVSHYQVGYHKDAILQVPKNIVPPDGGRFLCGLREVLKRPTGAFNYPWDVAIVGHKNSDKDSIAGEIPLNCDIKQGGGLTPDLAFPLRNWTDEDVWEYTEENNLPVQADRYDQANRLELPDKRFNSDYAHVCIACCDSRSKSLSVMCPKYGYEVSTVQVPYSQPNCNYFGAAGQSQGK